FTEWPEGAFAGPHEPMVIGIAGGDDPFNGALDQAVSGKSVNGHPLTVKHVAPGKDADLKSCHVLFVGAGQEQNLEQILKSVKGSAVLTVGESEKFSRAGGVIRLYLEENKVRFEVSPKAAK